MECHTPILYHAYARVVGGPFIVEYLLFFSTFMYYVLCMYYISYIVIHTYDTTITSKGTITIAAPLSKQLGLKAGQKISIALNKDNQIILDPGTDMDSFKLMRDKISRRIPSHLKGIAGSDLHNKSAQAWSHGYND